MVGSWGEEAGCANVQHMGVGHTHFKPRSHPARGHNPCRYSRCNGAASLLPLCQLQFPFLQLASSRSRSCPLPPWQQFGDGSGLGFGSYFQDLEPLLTINYPCRGGHTLGALGRVQVYTCNPNKGYPQDNDVSVGVEGGRRRGKGGAGKGGQGVGGRGDQARRGGSERGGKEARKGEGTIRARQP